MVVLTYLYDRFVWNNERFESSRSTIARLFIDKQMILLCLLIAMSVILGPIGTVVMLCYHVFFTSNGYCHIQLFVECVGWRKIPGAHWYLRHCVLKRHFDQNRIQEWCGGTQDDEYAWRMLSTKPMANNELESPSGIQLLSNLLAGIIEELDCRILPWLIWQYFFTDSIISKFWFWLLSTLTFALGHNFVAGTRWSWREHSSVFVATFANGTVYCLLFINTSIPWKTGCFIILWHMIWNTAAQVHRQVFAWHWFHRLFSTATKLERARLDFTAFYSASTNHPYTAVRDFLLIYHMIPHMYHRKPYHRIK